ncbi:flagellar hook assembly protein FlgD [Brevundimonas sp. SORGH_AS_0993]|uniref:flagellar hook assembly protein FlgD n=1 Tax=Brevundimonas sp. SORGH_AS_0993 TaxID=3041794 RepID=UPI002786E016|nr:flagellar hook capping FlgD N-terminal domain-containing protein [Brevundimonas sp. SORGH_AS_0993]MDQ1153007.1 flagellar basal-body rod modification protein FlgD [Brevundimonas sp. SORGH_AS_0993]
MVAAVSTDNATTRINNGGAMLSSNFETFLTLLTTQMKNQDPLSPLNSNEFTAQLTQMAGVEQQLLTNDLLTSLLKAQSAGGLDNASNYIGKNVTAAWSAAKLTDGKASWSYELGGDAAKATLQVLDSKGAVVWEGAAPNTASGIHQFNWDGKTSAGDTAADGGVYTLKISAADSKGAKVDAQTLTQGRVTGVEMYDGAPYLVVGNSVLPLSTVISLNEIKSQANSTNSSENPNASTEQAAA